MVSGRTPGPGGGGARRHGEPRRLGEILVPALGQIAASDQARAYGAWTLAAGDQVAGGARPRNFARGTLTVECSSSVWANELTYLSADILRRMEAVAPDHPVKKLRFVVASVRSVQEPEVPAAKNEPSHARPVPGDFGEARAEAAGVRDERLRAVIEALLETSAEGSGQTPREATPEG